MVIARVVEVANRRRGLRIGEEAVEQGGQLPGGMRGQCEARDELIDRGPVLGPHRRRFAVERLDFT
jgi:hypothetical protein